MSALVITVPGAMRGNGRPRFSAAGGRALNKIVWQDDSQIVSLAVQKFYAAEPGTTLTVVSL